MNNINLLIMGNISITIGIVYAIMFFKIQKFNSSNYSYDGLEGYKRAKMDNYDCIVLDLNIPTIDGLEVAKKLREENVLNPIKTYQECCV